MTAVLAFDLGATSARGIVYRLENGYLEEAEVFRFDQYQYYLSSSKEYHWDMRKIKRNIKKIIAKAYHQYQIQSIGFDTWGCDFGLIDENNQLVMDPLSYQTMLLQENSHYGRDLPDLFRQKTGIENASINSSSQLIYLKEKHPEKIKKAKKLLMMPDLIHFLLTGSLLSETSIASTSQLFDLEKNNWSCELLKKIDIDPALFSTIVLPYTQVGTVPIEQAAIPVYSVMQHDTASAVYALPSTEHTSIFLSSGTWSVLGKKEESGISLRHPLQNGYSYEQSGDGKILQLKNLLGMWYIEEALTAIQKKHSLTIEDLQPLNNTKPISFYFDTGDHRFSKKGEFTALLESYGQKQGYSRLSSPQELITTIYQNLAFKYTMIFEGLITQSPQTIFLFGGGSRSSWLNQLLADLTKCTITVCYPESSALGNALAQYTSLNEIKSQEELIMLVANYAPLKHYHPKKNDSFEDAYKIYQSLFSK